MVIIPSAGYGGHQKDNQAQEEPSSMTRMLQKEHPARIGAEGLAAGWDPARRQMLGLPQVPAQR